MNIIFGAKGGLGPPNYLNNKKKCVFNKSTIKVCVSYSWRCPSDLGPYRAPHMMGFLFPWSSGSNAPDMLREIEVCHSSSKSPSRVWDGDKGVAGRIGREKYIHEEGSLFCPPGKSMIFLHLTGPPIFDFEGNIGFNSKKSSYVFSLTGYDT